MKILFSQKITMNNDTEESNVIVVMNLTRPFTVNQLKEMLKRTGTLNDFWIDRIKSKCCAQFATVAQASETRMALNGVTWPQDNKTPLAVYYSSEEEMQRFKEQVDEPQRIVTSNGARGIARDWDREKLERAERRNTRDRSPAPAAPERFGPVKTLEELFNKTKTVPALYWKPLTEEVIRQKEEARNRRMREALRKKSVSS